jgi:hypothetical protein
MGNGTEGKSEAIATPEGWLVNDLQSYRYLKDYSRPRPYALLYVLRHDVWDWQLWALWGLSGGVIALGVAFGQWLAVPFGALSLAILLWMQIRVALAFRNGPLETGVVRSLSAQHPFKRNLSLAQAERPDGRVVPVVLPSVPASSILDRHDCVEVLFLYARRSKYSLVLAVREMRPTNQSVYEAEDSRI